jgi:hypothetical protein
MDAWSVGFRRAAADAVNGSSEGVIPGPVANQLLLNSAVDSLDV